MTIRRRPEVVLALALAACATPAPAREPIGIDALVADAPGYVAQRYRADELPAALIADLTAADFRCQHSAAGSECGRTQHAFASCFDVVTVRISPTEPVQAEKNRRCLGANG